MNFFCSRDFESGGRAAEWAAQVEVGSQGSHGWSLRKQAAVRP